MAKVIEVSDGVKPPRKVLSRALLPALLVFGIPDARGADETTAPDVVVTANRIATPAASLGSSVTVITAEDIERAQVTEVPELLRRVPGLAVSQTGGAGRATAVRMRGMEGHHTLLLINGVEAADTSSAQQSYDFGHLVVGDIERIEIVRGPQSTLYGADAIGGVINVITRQGKGAPRITGAAEYGSYDTVVLRSGLSGSWKRLDYAADVAFEDVGGFSAASTRTGNVEGDGYTNLTLNGRFGAQATDWLRFEAALRAMNSELQYDNWSGGRAVDGDDNMDKAERSGRLSADISLFDGVLINTLTMSRATSERDIYAGRTQTSAFDGSKTKLEYQGTWTIVENHALVFGAETEREAAETSGGIDDAVRNNGFYADYQVDLPDDSLSLTLGARLDDHEAFGRHDTYRVTAAYLLDATNTRFHASWGTGFRAPSLFELYDATWGNADLEPETSRGWDLGAEQALWDERIVVDVTWFDNRTKDLITWSWPAGYANLSSTRAYGLETSLTAEVRDDLTITAGHTYTESRNNATAQVLPRRPRHEGSASLTWRPTDDLSSTLGMRAVGRNYDSATGEYLGGYALFDVRASYDVTETFTVHGRIENLFDKQYEEADSYGTPGLAAYVGVRAAF